MWTPRRSAKTTCSPKPWTPARRTCGAPKKFSRSPRSEEHTSELQSQSNLVCRLLLEKKKNTALGVEPGGWQPGRAALGGRRPACTRPGDPHTQFVLRLRLCALVQIVRRHPCLACHAF